MLLALKGTSWREWYEAKTYIKNKNKDCQAKPLGKTAPSSVYTGYAATPT